MASENQVPAIRALAPHVMPGPRSVLQLSVAQRSLHSRPLRPGTWVETRGQMLRSWLLRESRATSTAHSSHCSFLCSRARDNLWCCYTVASIRWTQSCVSEIVIWSPRSHNWAAARPLWVHQPSVRCLRRAQIERGRLRAASSGSHTPLERGAQGRGPTWT